MHKGILKSFISIESSKRREIEVMVPMVIMYKKSLLQIKIRAKGRQCITYILFVLLVVRGMGTCHVIERHEFALVVGSKGI